MFSEIAVSEQFKSIVEALEPDVHQLFPVKGIHPQTGEPRTLDCYVFNCCHLVDGGFVEPQERLIIREMVMRPDGKIVDIERDNSSECEGEYWRYKLKHRHPYRLNKAKVGDKHCWLDRHHDSYLFVSDEFHAALVKNNIQAALDDTQFFPLEGKDYGEGT